MTATWRGRSHSGSRRRRRALPERRRDREAPRRRSASGRSLIRSPSPIDGRQRRPPPCRPRPPPTTTTVMRPVEATPRAGSPSPISSPRSALPSPIDRAATTRLPSRSRQTLTLELPSDEQDDEYEAYAPSAASEYADDLPDLDAAHLEPLIDNADVEQTTGCPSGPAATSAAHRDAPADPADEDPAEPASSARRDVTCRAVWRLPPLRCRRWP